MQNQTGRQLENDGDDPQQRAANPARRCMGLRCKATLSLVALAAALSLGWFIASYTHSRDRQPDPFKLSAESAADAADSLTFLALGDTGYGNAGQRRVAEAMSNITSVQPIDFVMMLGDNFYDDGVTDVDDALFKDRFEDVYGLPGLMVPFYAVAGNHDHHRSIQPQIEYSSLSKRWTMPSAYYSWTTDVGGGQNALFVAIDTETLRQGDDQWRWLTQTLATSDARWTFVFGHHPVVRSPGNHIAARAARLVDLFDAHGVDLYLCGHEHELVYFKRPGGTSEIISGAGGKARDLRDADRATYAGDSLGYACIRVERDVLRIALIDADSNVLMRDEIHHKAKPDARIVPVRSRAEAGLMPPLPIRITQ